MMKEMKERAKLSLELILNEEKPELIDEWNLLPEVWDAVRRKCDDTIQKGNYILTCSTKLTDEEQKEKIHHSGAGRIGKIKMHTDEPYMNQEIPQEKFQFKTCLVENKRNDLNDKVTLDKIANLIIRGGWAFQT